MARKSAQENAIINEKVQEMVYSGQFINEFKLEIEAERLQITKKVLKDKCHKFFESIKHELTQDEVHLYYRGCIAKLLLIIQETRCTPTEKTRAISELNKTIESYNTAIKAPEPTAGHSSQMLQLLLRELYSTEEGINLIQRVEHECECIASQVS